MFPIIQPQAQFSVLDIPGLFAWYSANNVNGDNTNPITGTAINGLVDLGPYAYTFEEQGSNTLFTTNLQNGHPGVVFSSTSDFVGPANFLSHVASGIYTVYIVMKGDSLQLNIPLVAVADDLVNRFIFIVPNNSTPPTVYIDYGDIFGSHRLVITESDFYGTTYAHCLQANTPTLSNFRNNVTLGANANCGSFTPGIKNPHMGQALSGGYTLFEMICCNQAHDAAQRAQVFSYLNNFWKYE